MYLVHVAALPLAEHEVKTKVSDVRTDETQHDAATRHIVSPNGTTDATDSPFW